MFKRVQVVFIAMASWLVCIEPSWAASPSNDEQLWLEMINRFRADPVAELDKLANYTTPGGDTFADPASDDSVVANSLDFFNVDAAVLRNQFNALTPAPPLAWSLDLNDSAEYYSGVMIANNSQSHTLDGLGLIDRFRNNSDYDFTGGGTVAENIFAFTRTVTHGHAGFIIDWGGGPPTGIQNPPGHRDALMSSTLREIGIAMEPESNPATSVGPFVVTQHLAVDFADGPFLNGVAFVDDVTADGFYSAGEGQASLLVEVLTAGTDNLVTSTTTWGSGGYAVEVPTGTYDVRLSNQSFNQTVTNVEIDDVNVKLDLVELTGLTIDLGSTFPNTPNDPVSMSGAVIVGGTLDLALLDGFTPDFGDQFVVVTADTRSGQFDQINGVMLEGGDLALAPIYDYQDNIGLTLVAALPGDANLDGAVNGDDLDLFYTNAGSDGDWLSANFNGDRLIDLHDLDLILRNLGRTVSMASFQSVAQNVPEPGTLSILLLSTLIFLKRRWSQRLMSSC